MNNEEAGKYILGLINKLKTVSEIPQDEERAKELAKLNSTLPSPLIPMDADGRTVGDIQDSLGKK